MVKQILKIMLISLAMLAPLTVSAHEGFFEESGMEQNEAVKIAVRGHSVRVQQAQGMVLEVYSVTGAKVVSVRIDTQDQTVNLNLNRGCYILKVGDVARKISLL